MLTKDLRANFWNGMTWAERLDYIIHIEGYFNVKIGHSNSEKTFKHIGNQHLLRALNADANKPITIVETSDMGRISEVPTSNDTVLSKVKKVVRNVLHLDSGFDVSVSAHIMNDVGADSLDFVEIIMEVEKEFDVAIPDEIAENLSTVKYMAEYVSTLLGIGESRERSWFSKKRPTHLGFPG